MNFAGRITAWYKTNKRDLPWRKTKDPYFIWLSEIILQQTRIDQGLGYYNKFTQKYPDVYSLAAAKRDEVFKLWQGLGYYNRADHMLRTAKQIVDKYNGEFPEKPETLLKLPGIGPYTSAAIASIAFDIPVPVIDGNVFRVLARIYGIQDPVNSGAGIQMARNLAKELLDKKNPGNYNQAVMEFGALKCTPVNPDCKTCPFAANCFALNNKMVKTLPVKKTKTKMKNRFFYYFHLEYHENKHVYLYVQKRTNKDIWKNLYDFALTETLKKTEVGERFVLDWINENTDAGIVHIEKVSKEYRQQLSHQLIHAVFIKINVQKKITSAIKNSLILVPENQIPDYPVPRLIERYLRDEKIIK